MGATLDHMTGGRWGLNIVNGFDLHERGLFGLDSIPHDDRYVMAAGFTDLMKPLWREEQNVTALARYWSLNEVYVSPKTVNGWPVMLNAASSGAGLAYATRYNDLILINSPGGVDISDALESLPDQTPAYPCDGSGGGPADPRGHQPAFNLPRDREGGRGSLPRDP